MRSGESLLAAGMALFLALLPASPATAQAATPKPAPKGANAATYVYCAALAGQLDDDDGSAASQAYGRYQAYAKRAALQAAASSSVRSVDVDNAILEQFSSMSADANAAEILGRRSLRAAGGRFEREFKEICMPVLQSRSQ